MRSVWEGEYVCPGLGIAQSVHMLRYSMLPHKYLQSLCIYLCFCGTGVWTQVFTIA
jgi:hypothetical protein